MVWKCQKCHKQTPPWQVRNVDSRLCEMVSRVTTPGGAFSPLASTSASNGASLRPSLSAYKGLLEKMERLVHPSYYLCFIINHSLIQLYGEREPGDKGATVENAQEEALRAHNPAMLQEKIALCNRLVSLLKALDPGLANLHVYAAVVYWEMQSAILAMAGGEVDDDFNVLRDKPEAVKLARLYLARCVDCFRYEYLEVEENKLKKLALKKMEYLDFILNKFSKVKKA